MRINDMNIEIHQNWYNKTKVQAGVTHIVDTNKKYPLYSLEIRKSYYNVEKEDVVDKIIADLEGVVEHLKRIKEREEER